MLKSSKNENACYQIITPLLKDNAAQMIGRRLRM